MGLEWVTNGLPRLCLKGKMRLSIPSQALSDDR